MLPAGNYHGPVLGGALTTAKSGNPQVEIKFNARMVWNPTSQRWENVQPPPGEAIVERTLFLSCTDAAWEYTEKKLRALGFNGDFKAPAFSDDATTEGVGFTLGHETYEGKQRERWDLTKWGDRQENAPAGADVVRSLSARWTQAGMTGRGNGNAPSGMNASRPAGRPAAPPAGGVPKSTPPAPAPAAPATAAQSAPASSSGLAAIAEPITDKEGAWQAFCEKSGDDPDLQKWNAMLATVGPDESKFGAAEWARIGELVDVPF